MNYSIRGAMMRTIQHLILVAAAVATTGCFHAVVNTGRQPNGQTIERPWAHSFLGGLVPPSVTETAQACPGGVARVETKRSFLNLVAEAITFSIYSPMWIRVSCADATDGDAQSQAAVRSTASADTALTEAVRRSAATGRAVLVDLR